MENTTENIIEPFSLKTILSHEELILANILAESDMSEHYIRSILNRIAKESIEADITEKGYETRARIKEKYKFYSALLQHLGDIRKKNLKQSR